MINHEPSIFPAHVHDIMDHIFKYVPSELRCDDGIRVGILLDNLPRWWWCWSRGLCPLPILMALAHMDRPPSLPTLKRRFSHQFYKRLTHGNHLNNIKQQSPLIGHQL